MPTAAQKLEGFTLENGWNVKSLVPKGIDHTGGNFSSGYIVESPDGEQAFLKALDYQRFITGDPPGSVDLIKKLTEAFIFERDLLRQCRNNKLKRVIKSIADGELVHEGTAIPYIIFELAKDDVRSFTNRIMSLELAWILRTMHGVAAAVEEIHRNGICHQDLKPSNVLITVENKNKLGDFGFSATKECTLEHMGYIIPGDRNHAPPEALYGYAPGEWTKRREGYDMYQVGNLFCFLITRITATSLLVNFLSPQHRPSARMRMSYEQALPFLQDVYVRVLDVFENDFPDKALKEDAVQIVKDLCNPDVDERGDARKKGFGGNQYSMERFISHFDRIAKKCEFKLSGT